MFISAYVNNNRYATFDNLLQLIAVLSEIDCM